MSKDTAQTKALDAEEREAPAPIVLEMYVVVGCTIDGVPEGDTIEMDVTRAAVHVRRGRLKKKVEVSDADNGLRGDGQRRVERAALRHEHPERDEQGHDQ